MTQLSRWPLLATVLLALAGVARAQEPSGAPAPRCCYQGPGCCSKAKGCPSCGTCAAGCCAEESSCGAKCAKEAPCCAKGSDCATECKDCPSCRGSATATSAAEPGCCDNCAKGAPCCVGFVDSGTVKAAVCPKCGVCPAGCPCCAKGGCCADKEAVEKKGTVKGKKRIAVFVLSMLPPFPGPVPPFPVPVGEAVPFPPAPPMYAAPVPFGPPPPGSAYTAAPEPLPPPRFVGPAPALSPPPAVVCGLARPARTEPACCSLHVITEDGSDCLEVRSPGMQLTCEHITLKVAGQKPLKATAAGKQVCISSPCVNAKADSVSLATGENHLVLKGHVRVDYHMDSGDHAEIAAGLVDINLADGQLEFKAAGAGQMEMKPAVPAPGPNHTMAPASLDKMLNCWASYSRLIGLGY